MKNWTHKDFLIHEFEALDSTNTIAYDKAKIREISEREIIMAHSQNAGKGRLDRNWISPKGNLYFSMVLRPKIKFNRIAELSFVSVVALRFAVQKISQKSAKNKWPNDLLLDEKKLAGILLESKSLGDDCEFVVIGIGVNIASNPQNTMFPATNLEAIISPNDFLKNFLDEFDKIYTLWHNFGFEKIRRLWLEAAFRLNEKISIRIDDQTVEGIFKDMDETGALILNCEGALRKITVGDVGV